MASAGLWFWVRPWQCLWQPMSAVLTPSMCCFQLRPLSAMLWLAFPCACAYLPLPAAAPAPKVVPNARAAANVRLTELGAPARDDPLLGDATLFQRGTFTWALP